MEQKELSELTDQELMVEAKKMKKAYIINAFLIGFLVGIIIYGVAVNGFGFFALIPLFIIYKLVNNTEHAKRNKVLQALLKERNLG